MNEGRARHSVVLGMRVGVLGGAIIASVDCLDTLTGHFTGNRWALVPYLWAFELLILGLFAGSMGLWASVALSLVQHSRSKVTGLVRATLVSLPWAVAFALIPTGWIAGHWDALPKLGKALAIVVCPAIFAGIVVVTWLIERLLRSPSSTSQQGGSPKLVAAGAFVLAVVCYWMDRTLYVGLYETFHVGLALFTVNLVLLGVLSLHLATNQGELGFRKVALALIAALLVVAAGEVAHPHIFGPSRSLIFAKLVQAGRWLTDFDRDGASALIGGSDCAGFDSSIAPGSFDKPDNTLDEDCTGTAAAWPAPRKADTYPIADLQGNNLLIISIDALRADHLGVYGYGRNTSPNIDRLAEQSVRFTLAFSQATKTIESIPSFLSGLYPSNIARDYDDDKVYEFAVKRAEKKGHRRPKRGNTLWYRVDDSVEVLPETMRQNGYATAVMTAALRLELLGLDQGAERVEVTKRLTNTAQSYLEQASGTGKPFFLWVHYIGPHEPYDQHEKFPFGDKDVDRYDSEIANDDDSVGLLLQTLREQRLDENTIIVLTSDHGEEFGDHGGRSHGLKLYRELLNVPLLLKIPGMQPKVVDSPVELVDIVPTLCDLLRLKESCSEYDGQSLLSAIAGQRDANRGAYAESYRGVGKPLRRSLRNEHWRFIDDIENDRRELYDLGADPNEQRDLSQQHPEVVQELLERSAVRPLLRQSEVFAEYQRTQDVMVLARGFNTLRHEGLIQLALDRLEHQLTAECRPYLETLAHRQDLGTAVTSRAARLAQR